MFDIESLDTQQHQSVTATVCADAQLFGVTPERGEFDHTDAWDRVDAIDTVSEVFRIMAEGVGLDGFRQHRAATWEALGCAKGFARNLGLPVIWTAHGPDLICDRECEVTPPMTGRPPLLPRRIVEDRFVRMKTVSNGGMSKFQSP